MRARMFKFRGFARYAMGARRLIPLTTSLMFFWLLSSDVPEDKAR